jgi:hypothetical protein
MRFSTRRVALMVCALVAAGSPAWAADAPLAGKDGAWTVLFRSDDPTLWGQTKGKPSDANGFALPLTAAPEGTTFVRLRRMDTGDMVIVRGTVTDDGTGPVAWTSKQTWNMGASTGYLLGIVEHAHNSAVVGNVVLQTTQGRTNVGYLGWGFGRLLGNAGAQGFTWEGQPLAKTVFEISATSAAELSKADESALLSPGVTTVLQATWGADDAQMDVTPKLISMGKHTSLRANVQTLGKPPGDGPYVFRVLFNINGEERYREYKDGEAVGIMAPATRVLSATQRKPGELRITSAQWSTGDKSVDVAEKLRAAIKNGKLEYEATAGNLGDPQGEGDKKLEIHYTLGGRELVGRFAEKEHVSLGEQIVAAIPLSRVAQDKTVAAAAAMKVGAKPEGQATLLRTQNTIKSLAVTMDDTGRMFGNAEDFIMTATPGDPRIDTPVHFVGKAGPGMEGVRDDVVRYLHVKFPKWAASRVDLSFEEREVGKDGGSIGAAVGTLLLSMLEGFDVDSHVAITGDVSADGKVRPIGGTGAKLRGAAASGATIVIIPAGNYDQLCDAVVYEGTSLVINTHVIGAATLEDAALVARTDRSDGVAAAIKLFESVQPELKKFPEHIHTKAVQDVLQQILTLAPNDLSAKLLLALGQNKGPKKLSSTATLYYLSIADRQVGPALRDRSKLDKIKSTTTPVAVQKGLNDLFKLRGIGATEVMPLVDAEVKLIQGINNVETGRQAPQSILPLIQNFEDAAARLKSDRDWMEKLLKEGI